MNRKEAIKEYKERKPERGAFAVRCTPTGRAWVGSSPNLTAAKNGIWFTLRSGSHQDRDLQTDWNTHGEAAFEFECLEMFDEELLPMEVKDAMKERKLHWAGQVGARVLL